MTDFHRTDVGNAKRLVSLFGDRLRFVKEWGWLWYDGVRWVKVDEVFVHGLAKQTLQAMEDEANELGRSQDGKVREEGKRLGKWAYDCEFGRHTELMVQKARDEVLADVKDFNPDPWLLNAQDVTIDLRDGTTHEHKPEDRITKVAGTSYGVPTEAGRFQQFLDEVFGGNEETIAYVQKVMGYSLVDVTREQHFWLAQGSGRNGKSTLFEITGEAMGDYAGVGKTDMILDQGKYHAKNFDLATLVGVRRVTFKETKPGQKLNEELIKELSGGDTTTAEAKFHQPFTFKPHFKMFLYTNHLPSIEEVGDSLWERLRVVPFNECFIKGRPDCHEPDPKLTERLHDELPGILRWLVQGALRWQEEGLNAPESVRVSTETYKEDSDDLAEFLEDLTVKEPGARTKLKDLHAAFDSWFDGNSWEAPESKVFGKKLTGHGYISKKSHGVMVYQGIRLKTNEERHVQQGEKVLAQVFPSDEDEDKD